MGYRVDIYDDGTAAAISDTPAVGLKIHMPGKQIIQSMTITQEHFKQLRSQQEANPGHVLAYDAKGRKFSVVPADKQV